MISKTIRLGTRKSALARWQAEWVATQLGDYDIDFVYISTQGDQKLQPIGNVGGVGVFTKEIQQALLDDQIDLAVHSLKDLPTESIDGLTLSAVPKRETTRDALIGRTASTISGLAANAIVGTGSSRRKSQLLALRSDLKVIDIRGNVDTRIAKLDHGEYDAIVLAEAGLKRLGLCHRITELISESDMLPAIGQGALGLETRSDDAYTIKAVARLDHFDSRQAVLAERSLLAKLQGGCLAPVAALATCSASKLSMAATVLSEDGSRCLKANIQGESRAAESLGQQLAEKLLSDGAASLIESTRN